MSVVVCSRDRTEQLSACMPSLLALDYPRYEIIVVDNAPETSATADMISQRYGQTPQVRYVREDRPGLNWARNCGLRNSRGEIVAYTDDDVVADPHWPAELVKGFQIADDVACVTGLILPEELETQAQVWFEQFGGFSRGRSRFTRCIFNMSTHRLQDPLYPYLTSEFGAGANMAFKTAILRTLGGFDVAFGTGTPVAAAAETETFFRIIADGYTLVYEPAALVHHFHRRNYNSLCKQLRGYGIGFTAFLTRCLIDDPTRLFYLLSKLPYALHYLLNPRSPRNKQKLRNYPQELTRAELKGMVYGPFMYLRSLWHLRGIIKQSGPLQVFMPVSEELGKVDGLEVEN